MTQFVSRAGEKIQHALTTFQFDVKGLIVADFGSSTGGFVDCLLQNGASKVYAVEVGYGTLDWKLRNDSRVVVMERTNAMFVALPEKVDLVTIDAGWTKQQKILPNALKNLKENGNIISLIKPHYEANKKFLVKGLLKAEHIPQVLSEARNQIQTLGLNVLQEVVSPILGEKGKNTEYLWLLRKEI